MSDQTQPDLFGFLHIDLNSFFASVEQELHPEYRGKPLNVVGTMADTGALIAASYEAKAFGVKTLTKVGEAKKLIPASSWSTARMRSTPSSRTRSLPR